MHLYFRKISKRKKNFNPTYIQYNRLRASCSTSPLSSSLLLLAVFLLCSCCCARGLCSRGVLSFSLLLGAGGPCGRRDTSGRQRMPWRPETRERGQQAPDPRLRRETLEPWREKQHELTEHELGTSGLLHPKSPTAGRDEPNWKPDAEKRTVRAHVPRHQRGPSSRRIRLRPRAPPRAGATATPRPRASALTPPPPASPARPSARP